MRQQRYRRAGVAIALAAIALVAGTGAVVVRAEDDPVLPAVTAQDLLASAFEAASTPTSVAGDVSTTLELGLPELPMSAGSGVGMPGVLASFTGEQRWKVWSSPDGLRVAHLLPAREQDLVMDREDAWWWDSATLRAIHLDLAELHEAVAGEASSAPPSAMPMDPVALARALMDGLAPCASLSVQGTDRVAGRDAYVLALIPLSSDTLVGSVRVSVDAQTRLPLRVEVLAADGDAPISAGFTSVSFSPIDPSMFTFDPPPGADVRDLRDIAASGLDERPPAPEAPAISDVRTFGTCLGAIVAVRLEGSSPAEVARLLPYSGPLASAIAVDRGGHTWILAGMVDADALEARAATLP